MKRITFNDYFGYTDDITSGRQTQIRRPLSQEGTQSLQSKAKKQDIFAEDGSLKAVPSGFEAFTKRYSAMQVGEVRAIQQTYNDIWRSTQDEDYRHKHQHEQGWNNKGLTQCDYLLHHLEVLRMRFERLRDITDEDALASGVVPCYGHNNGELLGYWHKGLPPEPLATPAEAFIKTFFAEYGDAWGDNPWCWVYEIRCFKAW